MHLIVRFLKYMTICPMTHIYCYAPLPYLKINLKNIPCLLDIDAFILE